MIGVEPVGVARGVAMEQVGVPAVRPARTVAGHRVAAVGPARTLFSVLPGARPARSERGVALEQVGVPAV
jgi:hypothetical protein